MEVRHDFCGQTDETKKTKRLVTGRTGGQTRRDQTGSIEMGAILDGLNQVYYFIFGVLISADLAASCFTGAYLLDKPFRILSEKGKYEKKSRRFAKAVISVVYWVIVSLIFCANFLWFDNKEIAVAAIVVGAIIYFAVFFALLYMNSGKKRS